MNPPDLQRLGNMLRENPQFVFIGWLSLGVISWLFFHFVRSAALKRFLFPLWTFAVAGLFLGLVAVMFGIRREMACVAVPVVIVISLLNILTTRFCDHCGRTLIRQPFRARFCPHCGEPLS
jgi:hypothetical protein